MWWVQSTFNVVVVFPPVRVVCSAIICHYGNRGTALQSAVVLNLLARCQFVTPGGGQRELEGGRGGELYWQ